MYQLVLPRNSQKTFRIMKKFQCCHLLRYIADAAIFRSALRVKILCCEKSQIVKLLRFSTLVQISLFCSDFWANLLRFLRFLRFLRLGSAFFCPKRAAAICCALFFMKSAIFRPKLLATLKVCLFKIFQCGDF